MGSRERRDREKHELRGKSLDAARELVAHVFWSAVHGIVSLQVDHPRGPHASMGKPKDIIALMLDVLIRGMSR